MTTRGDVDIALAARRLVASLSGAGVHAEYLGAGVVRAEHPTTGRREAVTALYSPGWNSLAWFRYGETTPIGPVDGLELVTGRIVDMISGRADR